MEHRRTDRRNGDSRSGQHRQRQPALRIDFRGHVIDQSLQRQAADSAVRIRSFFMSA